MVLLRSNIKPIYFKYLSAAFGSAMITSVYSIVDMAMVGQYQGPSGTAALAVVAPIWNIIYSLGLLMGTGGSVIFSTLRGTSTQKTENENEYFTTAIIGSIVLSVIVWLAVIFFDQPIFVFFGADTELLSLAQACNGVQREHNKKLNNGLPILHKVPPKRDYGRYFCILAEKGGTSHGGLTEKLSPFFYAQKQEVNAFLCLRALVSQKKGALA